MGRLQFDPTTLLPFLPHQTPDLSWVTMSAVIDKREALLFLVCVYEAVALVSPSPTISELIKRIRHRRETTIGVLIVFSYLAYHLLLEEF